jgi:hypothetical protein
MNIPHCTANAITWPGFFWVKVISFRVLSRATISALFEGIPLRGLEVKSVIVFLFYFVFLTSDIRSHVRALSLLGIEVWEFMGLFLGYESLR